MIATVIADAAVVAGLGCLAAAGYAHSPWLCLIVVGVELVAVGLAVSRRGQG